MGLLANFARLAALCALLACNVAGQPQGELVITGPEPPAPATDTSQTIALLLPTTAHPLYVDIARGARRAAREAGMALTVEAGAHATDDSAQIAMLRAAAEKASSSEPPTRAIVVAPSSSRAPIAAIASARQAGIPVVIIANPLDPDAAKAGGLDELPFVGSDDEHGAYLAAKHLTAGIAAPTQVAIIEGPRAAMASEQRKKGALRAFAENANITVVASEPADFKLDRAIEVVSRMLERHPSVGAIFCADDLMALAAIEHLAERGRAGVQIASYGGLEPARQAIAAGVLHATVAQNGSLVGYKGAELAARALGGQRPTGTSMVDIELITPDTLKQNEQ